MEVDPQTFGNIPHALAVGTSSDSLCPCVATLARPDLARRSDTPNAFVPQPQRASVAHTDARARARRAVTWASRLDKPS